MAKAINARRRNTASAHVEFLKIGKGFQNFNLRLPKLSTIKKQSFQPVQALQVPQTIDEATAIPSDLPAKLADAAREFVAKNDGTALAAIDSQIPAKAMGTAYKE